MNKNELVKAKDVKEIVNELIKKKPHWAFFSLALTVFFNLSFFFCENIRFSIFFISNFYLHRLYL